MNDGKHEEPGLAKQSSFGFSRRARDYIINAGLLIAWTTLSVWAVYPLVISTNGWGFYLSIAYSLISWAAAIYLMSKSDSILLYLPVFFQKTLFIIWSIWSLAIANDAINAASGGCSFFLRLFWAFLSWGSVINLFSDNQWLKDIKPTSVIGID